VPALSEASIERDPIAMFAAWFADARASVRPLPHAMALATTGPGGRVSMRMVLLKDFDVDGFVFYTNYRSRKARDLARNARASLLFYWGSLERQVRIEGKVTKVTRRESDEYFSTRPRGSQLGAWASPQSETIADRAALDQLCAATAARYAGKVPRPPHWGGYRLAPEAIEFWQGREDRLHDRILYRRTRNGRWVTAWLAP
jgi:pyridoxamine 5'-phosphate oxidase